jgi:hypothetical protein
LAEGAQRPAHGHQHGAAAPVDARRSAPGAGDRRRDHCPLYPEIGYLHTGIEKTCEAKFYQQVVPLTDRIDYLEPDGQQPVLLPGRGEAAGLEIPEKAQWLRVLLAS